MFRFARKLAFGAALAGVAAASVLAVVLAWRLSGGPIAMPFVAERLEDAFADVTPDLALRVRGAELAWWSRRPVVRVLDAELVRADGRTVGSIPALSVRPSLRAALRGRLTVAWLGLAGAHFGLVRMNDGELKIGARADAGDSGAAELIAALLSRKAGGEGQALPRIAIFDAHLVFEDRPSQTEWRAEQASIDIRPVAGGLSVHLDTKLTLRAGDKLLREAVVPLTATVNVARDADGAVEGAVFEAHAGAGRLAPAGDDDEPIALHALDAEGSYSAASRSLDVSRLRAAVGSAELELQARLPLPPAPAEAEAVAGVEAPAETASGPVLHLLGEVRSLPVVELTRLWPPGHASKPRDWIHRNIREGLVTSGRFELDLPVRRPPGVRLAAEAVDVAFDFEGLAIRYLEPIEPLRDVRGSATLDAERFEARVESAAAGDLAVANGDVSVELVPRPAPLDVTADVAGSLDDMLALLDSPPLEVPRKLGLSTAGAQGSGRVRTTIRLPLASGITLDDLDVHADASLADAGLAEIVAGTGVADADLRLEVHNRRFEIEGETSLTGTLPRRGPIAVALVVDAPEDEDKRISGVLDGPDLHASGEVVLDAAGLRSVSLSRVRLHRSDLSAHADRVGASLYHVSLDGGVLDLEPLLERLRSDEPGSAMPDVDWEVDMGVASVLTGYDIELSSAQANARGRAGDLRVLRASVLLTGESRIERDAQAVAQRRESDGFSQDTRGTMHARASQDGERAAARDDASAVSGAAAPDGDTGRPGVLEIDLAAEGIDGEEDRLTVFTDRAGEVLRALGIHDAIAGGRMSVNARLDGRHPTRNGTGVAEVDGFRVLDAPLLARILGLGSLEGVASLLGGEGIGFTHARVPLAWSESAIDIDDARAVGAIGVTASGSIDRTTGALEMGGQIIPAYTLNSALGKVPLIGPLLVGGEGQGVFGIEYRVGGHRDAPEIGVNPLSALAPGALRQMFVDPFTPRKSAAPQETVRPQE